MPIARGKSVKSFAEAFFSRRCETGAHTVRGNPSLAGAARFPYHGKVCRK